MSAPTFDDLITQVLDALRAAQADLAIAHLTKLLSRQLTLAQQAHAHALLAQAYEFQSRWDEAAQLLRPYEERFRNAALPAPVQQLVYLRLASLHTEQGDLHRAIHFARQALHLAELAEAPRTQGEAHQALGKAYRLLGQPVFARQHYQAALNLHQQLGARVLLAWSYLGLAAIAIGSSEYALAKQSFQRAHHLVSVDDDPLLYGLLCGVQASSLALEEIAPLEECGQWFAQAITAFEQIDHQRFRARTLGNWGHQLVQRGQWQEGQKLLQQALVLGQELQDRRSLASVLEALAELHTLQGKYETSQSYLAEALSWIEGHDHFVELQVRFAVARWHWQQGHFDPARIAFARVVAFAAETETRQWQTAAQLYLAELALQEGDGKNAAELIRDCQTALANHKNLGLAGQLRFLEGGLALLRQELPAAREALEQARTIFAVSGRRWWLGRIQFTLAEVLRQTGQESAAHKTMRQAEREFLALAAQPFVQQCHDWFQQHPLIVRQAAPARRLALTESLLLPESDGVGRLLRAVPFREVVVRELLVLLQSELPACHLTLSEPMETGEPRKLLTSPAPRPKGRSVILRLEPWRSLPLWIELCPAPIATTNLSGLLQAAQTALEVCAARERESFAAASEQQTEHLERPLPGLLYQSQAMRALATRIAQITGSDITVLLLGETGTGKELLAQAIHALSNRQDHPFVPFNCASLAAALVEAQLFGYRKGAYTGATEPSEGVIRAAERGTLFLDEIGDLPLEVQPKLLRFLQNKEIHPLGASRPLRVNVRLIAATHHSLEALMQQGKFREDLHYRLNVLPLSVPPLRERREEIPLLAQHFLARYSAEMKKPILRIAPEALDALMVYDWPGNVRQLENELQRLVALLPPGTLIRATDLADRLRPKKSSTRNGMANPLVARSLTERVAEVEHAAIRETLAKVGGNITHAARLLKLSRKGLQLKLKRYHLEASAL